MTEVCVLCTKRPCQKGFEPYCVKCENESYEIRGKQND